MREEYRWRRDYLYSELKKMGFSFPLPGGAFYMFAPLGESLTGKIIRKGVIIVPGAAFGCNAPGHTRMNYAVARDSLREAVGRIRAAREE
jgi:aspartate aminotransferase